MPELFVSVTSALDGYSDMAIGNIIGSNVCNLLLILGLSAILKPVNFQKQTMKFEIPMCLLFTIILLVFCNTGAGITFQEGIILIILFFIFISYTIFMGKKQSGINAMVELRGNEKKPNSMIKNILFVVFGVIGLKIGGDLVVNNAVDIAQVFKVSEKIISLTILAVGTSLPELVTSVVAAIKGDSDIAIGNIIGSNIFNMLLIIGTSSIIKEITYNMSYNFDFSVLMFATIVLALFPFIPPKNEMSRSNGVVYLLMYFMYLGALFVL